MTPLYCAVCWPLPGGQESDAPAAVSIVNGNALCREHMPTLSSPEDNTPQVGQEEWVVWLYEVDCDPGGYEGKFTVTAISAVYAERNARARAERAWPDAGELQVYKIWRVGEEDQA